MAEHGPTGCVDAVRHVVTPNKLVRKMGKDGNMYWFCDSCDFVKKKLTRAKRHEGRCPRLRAEIVAKTPFKPPPVPLTPAQSGRKKLRRALKRAVSEGDPWEAEGMLSLRTERVVKHRYDPVTRQWQQGIALVKVQTSPFAEGAMRECYRLKKLIQQPNRPLGIDWRRASNYVAKRYKTAVDRGVYFDDVMMQMDAHYWGVLYNRQGVTKQVDFIQAYLMEFVDREDCPLFCVERFIGGAYRKYNSNSGFVLEEHDEVRHTPQTFSHFTFHHSGGQAMVVDVQGVGDLYTDPQIHTAEGTDYGEGNLGVRGMALFFSSHICNPLCQRLGLPRFGLCKAEELDLKRQYDMMQFMYAGTQVVPTAARERKGARRRQAELMERMEEARHAGADPAADAAHATAGVAAPGAGPMLPTPLVASEAERRARRLRRASGGAAGGGPGAPAAGDAGGCGGTGPSPSKRAAAGLRQAAALRDALHAAKASPSLRPARRHEGAGAAADAAGLSLGEPADGSAASATASPASAAAATGADTAPASPSLSSAGDAALLRHSLRHAARAAGGSAGRDGLASAAADVLTLSDYEDDTGGGSDSDSEDEDEGDGNGGGAGVPGRDGATAATEDGGSVASLPPSHVRFTPRSGYDEDLRSGGAAGDDGGPAAGGRELPEGVGGIRCTQETAEQVLGRVHAALAEYHRQGRVSDPPNLGAWRHHHEAAAARGAADSAAALAVAVETGTVLDDALPGQDGPDPAAAVAWYRRAAELGCGLAKVRLGVHLFLCPAEAPGDAAWDEARQWLAAAVDEDAWGKTTSEESKRLIPTDAEHERHRVLNALAEMAMRGGYGVRPDPAEAARRWDEASEAAMGAMRMKAANEYLMRAEEARGEE